MIRASAFNLLKLLIVVAFAIGLGTAAARADALDDAKAAGLVGEQPDGYLGAVSSSPSPDVLALIDEINAKRLAAYQQIAADKGASVEDVAALTAEKLYQKALPGTYLLVNGQWVQK